MTLPPTTRLSPKIGAVEPVASNHFRSSRMEEVSVSRKCSGVGPGLTPDVNAIAHAHAGRPSAESQQATSRPRARASKAHWVVLVAMVSTM
jgi:hypothetical protein